MHLLPRVAVLPLVCAALALTAGRASAQAFVAPGSTALLSVEVRYESQGKRQDKHDLFEWRGKRVASFSLPLTSGKPSPVSQLTGPDAAQQARTQNAAAKGQKAGEAMAPMMASVEQIMARCGEDEACITREVQKMGARLQGSAQVAAGKAAVDDAVQAAQPGAPRYQAWQGGGSGVQGRYEVDEFLHVVHADPICMSLPRARCTRDESRKGQGAMSATPSARDGLVLGAATAEWDARQRSLSLRLPTLGPLPVQDTYKTDEPKGTHSTEGLVWLKSPDLSAESLRLALQFTVPATAALKGLAGERKVAVTGADGAGGSYTVRWRIDPR